MRQEEASSKIGKEDPEGGFLRAGFDDFDLFAKSVVSWDLSFLQVETGPFRAELSQVMLPSCMLLTCSLSRGLVQQGGLPPGCRTIGIPLAGCTPFRWRGHEVADDVMMIFPRGGELDSRSSGGFQMITLSVRESMLREMADREGLEAVLGGEGRVVRPPESTLRSLRSRALSHFGQANQKPASVFERSFQIEVERELSLAALEGLSRNSVLERRPMAFERSRALKAAVGFIEERAREPIQVGEIADWAGCSVRTLRYAFEEEYQVSPKAFLKARRLLELRRSLRAAEGSEKVSSLAADLGFRHPGQLAADYRGMFGEFPSETLAAM